MRIRPMKPRPLVLAPLSVALAALAGAAQADSCRLAELGWMAGTWVSQSSDEASEERWVAASGARLMGSSWALHPSGPGGLVEIESLLADPDGRVRLRVRHFGPALDHPWEAPDAPMTFAATRCGPADLDLTGEDGHAGERIRYQRTGDVMTFTGDFLHQGKPVEVAITFHRQGA